MEASAFGQWPETANFRVHLHQPSPEINLGETLIRRDGVHLTEWEGLEWQKKAGYIKKKKKKTNYLLSSLVPNLD